MKKPKRKIVKLRLPKPMIVYVKTVAKLAGTTPTTVFNVLTAIGLIRLRRVHDLTPFGKPARRRR